MSSSRISGQGFTSGAGSSRKYGLALLAVALAVAVHSALHWFLPRQLPFLPFASAVLVSCRWSGGLGGLAATMISAFVLRFWFLPPPTSFLDEGNLGMGLFLAAGLFVSWQAQVQERAAQRVSEPMTIESEPELPQFEYAGSVQS